MSVVKVTTRQCSYELLRARYLRMSPRPSPGLAPGLALGLALRLALVLAQAIALALAQVPSAAHEP